MAWTTSVKLGGTVPPSFLTVWSAFNDRKVSKNSTHRLGILCVGSGQPKNPYESTTFLLYYYYLST